jgi:hypothetical protein
MSNKMNDTLNYLLQNCNHNPVNFTYFAIGSAPHCSISELNERYDQIIPKFILDILDNTDDTIRIINIDEVFENNHIQMIEKIQMMTEYHKSNKWNTNYKLDFEYTKYENIHIWRTKDNRVESIIIGGSFTHKNRWNDLTNDWFIEKLCDLTLKFNSKLVVQEYTGYDLDNLRFELFNKSLNKELFKNKILIDITYGNNCGCGTDLIKNKPIYNDYYDFINFTLMKDSDMVDIIGKSDEIDEIIKIFFIKKFRQIIHTIYVDYRRKKSGQSLMFGHSLYNELSTAGQIMQVVLNELNEIIKIFDLLKMLTDEKKELIKNLFEKYPEYDIYKWGEIMINIYK